MESDLNQPGGFVSWRIALRWRVRLIILGEARLIGRREFYRRVVIDAGGNVWGQRDMV
ncbi:MAG: hypothetical protein AABN33_21285 [Acidobacteriota bacterium]